MKSLPLNGSIITGDPLPNPVGTIGISTGSKRNNSNYLCKGLYTMKITLEYKIQDFWIGLFWQTKAGKLHIYVCLIPCFPIHIALDRNKKNDTQ